MDVEGGQGQSVLARIRVREAQQDHRIEAAAEGNRERGCCTWEVFGAQAGEGLRKERGNAGSSRPAAASRITDLHHSSRGVVSLNLP
jgi:hypothetical protein